jgi:transcription-repair coupling factor (superfamily II helicase)
MPAAEPDGPELGLAALPGLLGATDGWTELRAALKSGGSGAVDSAWGSSSAVAVATVLQQTGRMVLAIVPHVTDLTPWADDLQSFTGVRPQIFPAQESWPPTDRAGKVSPETAARLRVLNFVLANPNSPCLILAPIAAVMQPVPPREDLAARAKRIHPGEELPPEELAAWLVANGYKRVESVEERGEFGRRGGILDLFPPDAADPYRLEFFGDELESIRTFAAHTQRSLEKKTELVILAVVEGSKAAARPDRGFITDYLPKESVVALVELADLKEQGKHLFERVGDPTGLFTFEGAMGELVKHSTVTISAMPRPTVEAVAHLRVESVERFSGNVQRVKDELDTIAGSDRVLIACQTDAEVHRLTEVLKAGKIAEGHRLQLVKGHVRSGFRLVELGIVVIGSHEIFHRDTATPGVKATTSVPAPRRLESRAIDSFLDLNEGDYVVHVAHGIARFRGMKMLPRTKFTDGATRPDEDARPPDIQSLFQDPNSAVEENLILEFRDGVFLYVPASRIDLVQKYVGGSQSQPELSKLGGTSWGRKKEKAAEAVRDMAADMIQLQAVRAAIPGEAFPPDTEWQGEFEAAFPYQETPDQLTAIAELKQDLMRPRPMDRLLCGDVGYGKTEVALRAVFKAIDNGKQVAVLVPTTVLAEQHFRTFSQRLAEYPFTVECLSRFKTASQQRDIVKRLGEGTIDVVIGTHRLVSEGVKFKDLGLVIIDEEQRFGVDHKERLKKLRTTVHILTMTATPIPRTLHGALLGVREISNLETPPPERYPVETRIVRWDDQLIRHAIHREFGRGGQVYFVHNRVYDILDVAAKLQTIVPDAKIVIGHGQMAEGELEKAMVKFIKKDANILVATTIIESGLDIPNANTIFIDEADQYGLADLHQLRGRVGRTKLRAYAYLLVDPLKMVTPQAQKRLKAIEEFTELGSGFKIAMRDLEIRGAGNILGNEQSGHIAAVGYEMYCQLLENAVRQLKNQPPRVAVEVNVDLPWPAFLPRDYVPGQKLRIEVYRRLARLREVERLDDFRQELRDRYGPPPEPVEWLLRTTEIRLHCVRWNIASVHRDGKDLIFSYKNTDKAQHVTKLSAGRMKLIDEKHIYLRLRPEDDPPEAMYPLLKAMLPMKG